MKKQSLLFILLNFIFLSPNIAQETQNASPINFFLDCWRCDFDYVRQNLEFISFVRDPNLADVHILSSSSRTGSGGDKYYLNFIGRNDFAGQNYEYTYTSDQSETDDETRNGLLQLIKTGIIQYYSQSEFFNQALGKVVCQAAVYGIYSYYLWITVLWVQGCTFTSTL